MTCIYIQVPLIKPFQMTPRSMTSHVIYTGSTEKNAFKVFPFAIYSFTLNNAYGEGKYLLSLSISECWETSGGCANKYVLFDEAVITKPACNWTTGYLIPGTRLSQNPNEKILYFTTENFTFLQKTLLYYRKLYYCKCIFSIKLEPIKIPFSIRKLTLFFYVLVLMDVLEYE